MRLVIKFACVADGVNLRLWEPVDRRTIAEFIYLEIGEKGTKRTDGFTIRVATPQGLKKFQQIMGLLQQGHWLLWMNIIFMNYGNGLSV